MTNNIKKKTHSLLILLLLFLTNVSAQDTLSVFKWGKEILWVTNQASPLLTKKEPKEISIKVIVKSDTPNSFFFDPSNRDKVLNKEKSESADGLVQILKYDLEYQEKVRFRLIKKEETENDANLIENFNLHLHNPQLSQVCTLIIRPHNEQQEVLNDDFSLETLYNLYHQKPSSSELFLDEIGEMIQKEEPIQYTIRVDSSNSAIPAQVVMEFNHFIPPLLQNGDNEIELNDDKQFIFSYGSLSELNWFMTDGEGEELNIEHDFNTPFSARLMEGGVSEMIFSIQGGLPPYYVSFPDKRGINHKGLYFLLEQKKGFYSLSLEKVRKKISTGTYNRISIYDNYKEEFINMELVDSMTMTEEKKGPPLAMIISLGVVFFSLLLVFIMRKKKETKKEKSDIPTIEKELEEEKELEKELGTEAEKETSVVASKKRLTVKGKRKMGGELSLEDFKEQIKKKDLIGPLDQEELWVDTVLKEIYFSPKFIADLQDFLEKESLEVMVEETGGMTPEIGGFLMGKYTKDKEDYHLSIEELIPFNPEYSDAFKIEIGTKTQVQELGTALEEHPDMAVVGWFHTHPGHGLFLSNPDQIVHQHFPHPFQVAMEIESLTDELDLAFFSRKKDGEMNNTYTSGKPKEWFSWKEVEQQSKT